MKILFRSTLAEEDELSIAKKYFDVIESRSLIKSGDNIICRYSSLPYYDELEKDVLNLGGTLLNSYNDHKFVADLRNWYYLLSDLTPKTWFSLAETISDPYEGPYVLKGATNSKKSLWLSHMFAWNKDQMRRVYFALMNDTLIAEQGVYIRQYEKFKTYGTAINGMPVTKEFRLFILDGKIIAKGYYWSNHPELIEQYRPDANEIPQSFLDEVMCRVSGSIRFWVLDVAQKEDGHWRIIELNDGTMAGLSCIDADEFYKNLKEHLNGNVT
jgi:hypothetical protein